VGRFEESAGSAGDDRVEVEFATGGEFAAESIPAGRGGTGGISLPISFALSRAISADVFLVAAVMGLGVIVPSVIASLSMATKSASLASDVSRTWPLTGGLALGFPLLVGTVKLDSLPSYETMLSDPDSSAPTSSPLDATPLEDGV
jgi:hypothetical protein